MSATSLEIWLENAKEKYGEHHLCTTSEVLPFIIVIEKLKSEMEFAMKYYESCGEEADPEFQLFRSFKKALSINPEKL